MSKLKQYSWEDVTVEKYNQIVALTGIKDIDETEFALEVLTIMEDIDIEEVMKLPVPKMLEQLQRISFISTKPKPRFKKGIYNLNGIKYELCPSASNMITGQWIDYNNFLQEDSMNYSALISTVLVPQGKTYNEGYDVLNVMSDIEKHMSIVDVLGICFFFRKVLEVLSKVTLSYSEKTLKKELKKEKSQEKQNLMRRAINSIKATKLNGLGK